MVLSSYVASACIGLAIAAGPELKLTRTIPLPGACGESEKVGKGESSVGGAGTLGRFDHLAYDPATGRLFVAGATNNSMEVVDLGRGERVKSIRGLSKSRGIGVAAATGQGTAAATGLAVVACGGDNTVYAFDTRTLEEKWSAPAGESPDNVRYDAHAGTIYVGGGADTSGAFVVFDTQSHRKTGDLPLPSRPTSFQLDPTGGLIFANLPGPRRAEADGQVIAIDRNTGKTAWLTTLRPGVRNAPMALDAAHGRVFVVCRKPAKLVELDARDGHIIAEAACVMESDDMGFDARTNRVIVIGGGKRVEPSASQASSETAASVPAPTVGELAAIDVFQVGGKGELSRISSTLTVQNAKTGMFVAERRAVYLAVPPHGTRGSAIYEYMMPD